MGRYTSNAPRGRANKDKTANKDEMPEYKSRVEVGASGMAGDAEFMKHIEDVSEVASLEQRWANSWKSSLQSRCVAISHPSNDQLNVSSVS